MLKETKSTSQRKGNVFISRDLMMMVMLREKKRNNHLLRLEDDDGDVEEKKFSPLYTYRIVMR